MDSSNNSISPHRPDEHENADPFRHDAMPNQREHQIGPLQDVVQHRDEVMADAGGPPMLAALSMNGAALLDQSNHLLFIHQSVLQAQALQYQQMFETNMRMMQLIAQDPYFLQALYQNYFAADLVNVHQLPFANFNTLPTLSYPMFPLSPRQSITIGEPELQEHDYDPFGEARKPWGQRCLLYLVEERHWVEALQRISSHPHEVYQFGIQRRAPIHLACDHDAPAFLVQTLMDLWPEGAFMVGTSYMNPLHITCSSRNASNEIVHLLLAGCGNPLRITSAQDIDGDTPLHAACRCAAPIDVLATLLQTNPATVFVYDYEGLNPLLRLWVRYYVVLDEPIISNIQSASDLTPDLVEGWQKSLLLLQVMDTVVKTNEGQGSATFRAVHCASALECPRCVLRISMILYPDQILTPDEHGRLPLHIATNAPVYRVHDLGGEGDGFPFNDAFDDDEINQRHEAHQQGKEVYNAKNYDDDGSPDNPLNEPSVIDILLSAAPTAAKIHDPSGRLPLHSAIGSGKGYYQGVHGLIEAYPAAMEFPDPVTNLYPFMLAATCGEGIKNVSTIFELMKLSPELIKMALTDDMDLKPKAR